MRIDDLLHAQRDAPLFSFEFFPPKTADGEANLLAALGELRDLEPDYVSVTYGAGGGRREKTIELVVRIQEEFGLDAMAHFTCVNATTDELRATLERMRDAGIDNVLALRGDPPQGDERWTKTEGGLEYSRELVELIRDEFPGFAIGAAAFPETHIHATSPDDDLRYTADKVAAGAGFLVTQMFFDNAHYFDFVERARGLGVAAPIIPGVLPITGYAQLARITSLCGSSLPEHLLGELEARKDDAEAVAEFGVAYATMQCADLLAQGAPGIHFYTLNRSPATRAILSALKLWRPWDAQRTGLGAPRKPPTPA